MEQYTFCRSYLYLTALFPNARRPDQTISGDEFTRNNINPSGRAVAFRVSGNLT